MTIRLYGFWRSNAAFRVRVALALKNLAFEEIDIDILSGRQFDREYADVNAEHVVPTLVHEDRRIFQSLAIIEYLDEVQREPQLLPVGAQERAYARALAMVAAADSHPLTVPRVRKYLGEVLEADPAVITSWCKHWVSEGLSTYERLLQRRPASPFALGSKPTIADICIAAQISLADVYGMDLEAYPKVAALGKTCFEMPAFAAAHPFAQPGYKTSNECART